MRHKVLILEIRSVQQCGEIERTEQGEWSLRSV